MPPKVTWRAIPSGIPAFSIYFGEKNPSSSQKLGKTRTAGAAGPGRGGSAGWEFLTLFPLGKSTLSQSKSNPLYPSPAQVQFIPVQIPILAEI